MLFGLLLPLLAVGTAHVQQRSWTIEELTSLRFPYESTNDQYLNVCKAGEYSTCDANAAPERLPKESRACVPAVVKASLERTRHKSRQNFF